MTNKYKVLFHPIKVEKIYIRAIVASARTRCPFC